MNHTEDEQGIPINSPPSRSRPMGSEIITKDNLPIDGWSEYRKVPLTRMCRMDGPFTVQTREGALTCPDGFLAVDSGGWPYPIAADEHGRIYEPAADKPMREALSDIAAQQRAAIGVRVVRIVGEWPNATKAVSFMIQPGNQYETVKPGQSLAIIEPALTP